MSRDKARKEAVREQSAQLAAALALDHSGPRKRGSRLEGGKLTVLQHQMLTVLAAAPKGAATPEQLIRAHPGLYGADPLDRGVTFSLHRVGRHLTERGYVKAGRAQERSGNTGRIQGGRRLYRITAAGRQALQ
jgi:hypothetical protein